ncbi:uncharacterized protein [Ambystoma mexicanum]|uniref:uncharacterized protein n=1 Tax=Ambystoma mexicanum TaxID=8296 RepID=UPI0037E7B898
MPRNNNTQNKSVNLGLNDTNMASAYPSRKNKVCTEPYTSSLSGSLETRNQNFSNEGYFGASTENFEARCDSIGHELDRRPCKNVQRNARPNAIQTIDDIQHSTDYSQGSLAMVVLKPFGFRILRRGTIPAVNISAHYLKKSRLKERAKSGENHQKPPKQRVNNFTENHLENTDNEALKEWLRKKKILLRRERTAQRKQKRLEKEQEKQKNKEKQQKEARSEMEVRKWMENKVLENALSRRFLEGLSFHPSINPTHSSGGHLPSNTRERYLAPKTDRMSANAGAFNSHTREIRAVKSSTNERPKPTLLTVSPMNGHSESLHTISALILPAEGVVGASTGVLGVPATSTLPELSMANRKRMDSIQELGPTLPRAGKADRQKEAPQKGSEWPIPFQDKDERDMQGSMNETGALGGKQSAKTQSEPTDATRSGEDMNKESSKELIMATLPSRGV